MIWKPDELVDDFIAVAELARIGLAPRSVEIEVLPRPHEPPTDLPKGKMAVYVFSSREVVFKVGRVGWRSKPRYTSQHYNSGSAPSTFAGSLLGDEVSVLKYGLNEDNVSDWIKQNTDRVNLLLDASFGAHVLALLEAFVQCRLQPLFEGSPKQR